MWELLKTVSLLKSEFIKDRIKLKKLMITKINCRKDRANTFWLIILLLLLKSLIETKQSTKENNNPVVSE